VISQDNEFFWVYGHCTRHGYSWLRASTQTPLRMPDLRVTPVWLRLAYSTLKSCPNADMDGIASGSRKFSTQIMFMVDVCNLERRGHVSSYADDAFEYEPQNRPTSEMRQKATSAGE
jgi:hypothetical protein